MSDAYSPPVLKVLSVDWDYYINATESERDSLFISSEFELSDSGMKKRAWDRQYANKPDLMSIDYNTLSFFTLRSYLSRFVSTKFYPEPQGRKIFKRETPKLYAYENHGKLYTLIQEYLKNHKEKTSIEVVNIDYHHDCFLYGGDSLNCGNWVRLLFENSKGMPFKYSWVRGRDSQPDINKYDMRTYLTFDDFMRHNPDFLPEIIFFCRSDVWTPPHLDKFLYKALSPINKAYTIEGFNQLEPRRLGL